MPDNLPELRDIHLPEGVSAWPPAYGWFVIVAAILLGIAFYHCWKKWRQASRKLYAMRFLDELERQNIADSGKKISELLRRICLWRYPEAVALMGDGWLAFIKQKSQHTLSVGGAELLKNAPYINPQKHSYTSENLTDLIQYTRYWIGENL